MLVGLDKNEQKMVLDTILGQKLNVRDTEKIIKKVKKGEDLAEFSEDLQEELEKLTTNLKRLDIPFRQKKSQLVLNLGDVEKIKKLNTKLS